LAVYLILGITFGFAVAIQPGPFQTFLISRTLQQGWRSTLPAACAPMLADIPIAVLVLLILNHVPAWAENVLHFAGGLFLLYLAYGAFQSFRHYRLNQLDLSKSTRQNFLKAMAVDLTNPNAYLAWSLVIGPMLLKAWQEASGNGIILLSGFYAAMIATNSAVIFMFAGLGKLLPGINRILIGISVAALAGFGLYQLWLGVASIL
jgi:threonine/homoserine/homoserine lactone efflux protein